VIGKIAKKKGLHGGKTTILH